MSVATMQQTSSHESITSSSCKLWPSGWEDYQSVQREKRVPCAVAQAHETRPIQVRFIIQYVSAISCN